MTKEKPLKCLRFILQPTKDSTLRQCLYTLLISTCVFSLVLTLMVSTCVPLLVLDSLWLGTFTVSSWYILLTWPLWLTWGNCTCSCDLKSSIQELFSSDLNQKRWSFSDEGPNIIKCSWLSFNHLTFRCAERLRTFTDFSSCLLCLLFYDPFKFSVFY